MKWKTILMIVMIFTSVLSLVDTVGYVTYILRSETTQFDKGAAFLGVFNFIDFIIAVFLIDHYRLTKENKK